MGKRSDDGDKAKVSHEPRVADLGTLKALGHPIRIELYDLLSQYGPATASGLAARIGESSGSTSYHLRQLEKHELVREIEGRGTARERWWERVPGGLAVSALEHRDDPSAQAITRTVVQHWHRVRERQLEEFMLRGPGELSEEWFAATDIATVNLRLNAEQLAEYVRQWHEFSNRMYDMFHDQRLPGSRPVQIQFNAFPLMDGEETAS